MASAVFHQAIGNIDFHRLLHSSGFQHDFGNNSLKLISKGSKVEIGLPRSRIYGSSERSFGAIKASASQASVVEPVSTPSSRSTFEFRKKSNEAALILIRHGESLWNEKNLFTGCVDVPLTKKDVEEQIEACKRISNIPVDMRYTSALIRAQMTATLVMTQHRRRKVVSLELSTGIPMLYIFKEGKFMRRGSPVGPTEAGVYAYTRTLAQHRQKLDAMLN